MFDLLPDLVITSDYKIFIFFGFVFFVGYVQCEYI